MEEKLPFDDGSFAVTIGDISLHYFNDKNTKNLMKEIKRILTPNGILLARVSSLKDKHGNYPEIEKGYYNKGSWAQRFFDEKEVKKHFGIIGKVEYKETSMTRDEAFYRSPKMLYQIKVTNEG